MPEQLWHATKLALVGGLAASIAHGLNKPLGKIGLHLESLLAQTPHGDPKRQALEIIQDEVDRMGNLVDSLLEFSRQSPPRVSLLDIRQEVERALDRAHHHLFKRNISVVQEFASDLPFILGDGQQLEQVFLILFTNAGDAMREGGTLTLRIFDNGRSGEPARQGTGPIPPSSESLARLTIEVADTRIWISPESLPKVMDPMFATKPFGTWTGLGLSICRRIIQEHHGEIEITGEVDRGTMVRITLPAVSGLDQVNRYTT